MATLVTLVAHVAVLRMRGSVGSSPNARSQGLGFRGGVVAAGMGKFLGEINGLKAVVRSESVGAMVVGLGGVYGGKGEAGDD